MCGITGMIHLEQDLRQQEALLRKMQETLRRRGPDQEGIFLSPRCAMAHTRLAVIDVEKGRQPMEITAGGETYTIVYNGELYNTPELRTQLEQEGVVFRPTATPRSFSSPTPTGGHAVWNSATAFSPLPSGNTPPSGSFWHVTASA